MKDTHKTKASPENQQGHPPRRPRLVTLQDVRRYLAALIHQTREGVVDPGLAAKIGYLLNLLTACIKDSDLEKRIEKLEQNKEFMK